MHRNESIRLRLARRVGGGGYGGMAGGRLLTDRRSPSDIPGASMATHDCTYELYLVTYKAARAAVKARDAARLAAMRAKAVGRRGAARRAAVLALDDAESNAARRSKADVCRPFCDTRCERGV